MSISVGRPLDGVKVVETASFLTGPLTSLMLADLGAEVIKVEPVGGDQFRRFGHRKEGLSALWTNINRGKRSIVLDLKSKDGLDTMKKLLGEVDVLVENWRPHVAGSLGLSQEIVATINPRLIRLSISGFGLTGPLSKNPGFDPLIQGRTGMASLRTTSGKPELAPYDVVDKIVGTFGAQAILAALYQRERTGKGGQVALAMLDVVTYFNYPDIFQHRTFVGDDIARTPRPSPVMATSDGYLIVTPVTGTIISRTLEILGRPDIKTELRSIDDPLQMVEQLYKRLAEVLASNTTAHWIALFDSMDVPGGPVFSLDEHLNDPQVLHNNLYSTIESPVGPVRAARYPAIFDGQALEPNRAAPNAGEHSSEIIHALNDT
jgi:crotonobetainyl-CoA:carnitine CoA-transferase CaiB-like acyl-CoA transferase